MKELDLSFWFLMKLDSSVNTVHDLKRFLQNLKRTIGEKVSCMHKFALYAHKTHIFSPVFLKAVNETGTDF